MPLRILPPLTLQCPKHGQKWQIMSCQALSQPQSSPLGTGHTGTRAAGLPSSKVTRLMARPSSES
eukprot:5301143-Amphidinium_carterae.1